MNKLLLLGGLTMCMGVATAQNLKVYEDFEKNKLNYYADNPTGILTIVNPYKTALNKTDSVGQFDRAAGTALAPKPYRLVSCGTKIPGTTDWGSFDMNNFPVISIDIWAADSMNFTLNVKDKTAGGTMKDIMQVDMVYDKQSKGSWKRLVADFSKIATWPAAVEVQLYFSHGVDKSITAYFDNIQAGKTVKDIPLGINELTKQNFKVNQNVPNPATDVTHIGYSLEANDHVSLKVYDILGACVATLVNEKQSNGNYSVPFDVSALQTGLYYYTLNVGGATQTQKIQVVR